MTQVRNPQMQLTMASCGAVVEPTHGRKGVEPTHGGEGMKDYDDLRCLHRANRHEQLLSAGTAKTILLCRL